MIERHEQSTLIHYLLQWQAQKPDAIYLTQPQGDGTVIDYSWAVVADQARRMATHLQAMNLPAGSSIAILGKNSAHWIIADLAIWIAGHISVPLYPTANTDTVRYVLEHAQARLLFVGRLEGGASTWQALSAGVPAGLPVISLPLGACDAQGTWDDIIACTEPLHDFTLPDPAQLATLIYTSGSTGQPKGVMHSFGTLCEAPMINACALFRGGRGPNGEERMLSYLPLAHGAERQGVEAMSLRLGSHVFFNDSLETFTADLQRARPTFFFSVPRLWTKFYQGINQKIPRQEQLAAFADPQRAGQMKAQILTALGLDQVHTALTGSAALPAEVISWYGELGLELLEGYAMSENFACSHFTRPGQVRPGYVGQCLPGVECRIADDGEILVKSPGQMLGYYKQPELTAQSYTEDGFFRTGDRGIQDEEGRLRIVGRVKELFKTAKGKYVAPVPIEMRLANHPQIEASCVTGMGLPQPFALINISPAARQVLMDQTQRQALVQSLEALLEVVNAQAESHEHLASLVVVSEPWTVENDLLTPTLKIRRNQIEDHYQSRMDGWSSSASRVIFE
ncbi:AMP-binding protein [Pseudomonas sp. NPDC090755]|uniref:AMP-binding protein n=1 Tax=Pseudomonas sp. NPDC090755 TaxID=3364481 RepID=UPI00383BF661